MTDNKKTISAGIDDIPEKWATKMALLQNFKEYMDTQLHCGISTHKLSQTPEMLLQWRRTENTIIFCTSSVLQVNFIADHCKLLFFSSPNTNNPVVRRSNRPCAPTNKNPH